MDSDTLREMETSLLELGERVRLALEGKPLDLPAFRASCGELGAALSQVAAEQPDEVRETIGRAPSSASGIDISEIQSCAYKLHGIELGVRLFAVRWDNVRGFDALVLVHRPSDGFRHHRCFESEHGATQLQRALGWVMQLLGARDLLELRSSRVVQTPPLVLR